MVDTLSPVPTDLGSETEAAVGRQDDSDDVIFVPDDEVST